MSSIDVSKISCIVDTAIAPLVDKVLTDLNLPEVFVQRAKQISLVDRSGWFGLRPTTILEENRAWIYRFYIPQPYESGLVHRIADTADLHLPGRGSIYAEDASVQHSRLPEFDLERLKELSGEAGKAADSHSILCCIVQRGMAEALAGTVLEMGLCVPVVSFGEGMGLRNKLGLLRITIPIDKEIIYFIVPRHDSNLLESVAVHKARLDRPGQGFIYQSDIRAPAVNLRVRHGSRRHAASMEQIVAALDEIRGSAEWRRSSPSRHGDKALSADKSDPLVCLSLMAEEGSLGDFVKAAMDVGAGGATLVPLEYRDYSGAGAQKFISHARESCDLIIQKQLQKPIIRELSLRGFFSQDYKGIAEFTEVTRTVTYRKETK